MLHETDDSVRPNVNCQNVKLQAVSCTPKCGAGKKSFVIIVRRVLARTSRTFNGSKIVFDGIAHISLLYRFIAHTDIEN